MLMIKETNNAIAGKKKKTWLVSGWVESLRKEDVDESQNVV